jgi:hypothetical protein
MGMGHLIFTAAQISEFKTNSPDRVTEVTRAG